MSSGFRLAEPITWAPAIRHAQADEFWIWTLIMLVIGLACAYGIFYFIRRARIIEDTPTSRIRSAPQGYVELTGRTRYLVGQAVEAPLTKRPCAWYRFTIERRQRNSFKSSSRSSWRTVEKVISERPFECIDETGSCIIDPRGAEVYTVHKDVWYGSSKWPSHGPGQKQAWFSSSDYRYTELRLHDSDPLYAIGEFRTVDPGKVHNNMAEAIRAMLRAWKQDQSALLERFDVNGDGQIDLGEWEQVRQAAEKKVLEQRLQQAPRPRINLMTRTRDFRRPYILSTDSQSGLAGSFRLKAIGCTLGCILFTPISIWMIYIRLAG
jgi:hypothetical protein